MIPPLSIVLAEDDDDDRLLFQDALREIDISTILTTVNDGDELMKLLRERESKLPNVLYLDINMPRKNGLECLAEMKNNAGLSHLPVIIFSTCFNVSVVNQAYKEGATYYMRKPSGFLRLKDIVERSLQVMTTTGTTKPLKDKFILNAL